MRIIAGKYKNITLKVPKGFSVRPTTGSLRGALFNIVQTYIEGATFLDLFAGSGAMGLEALSRGASKVLFIEKDKEGVKCIKENIDRLGVKEQTRVVMGDCLTLLPRVKESFTIIYADPPYDLSEGLSSQALLDFMDGSNLIAQGGEFFLEDSADFSPTHSHLKTLVLTSTRRNGRSALFQFTKI